MDGVEAAQETLTTSGLRWARAVPWGSLVLHRGRHRERAIETEALAVGDPQPGTTGVGLSVWKLLLALQGDRDRLTL